eukprot:CAMPEP_0197196548 /NCGR_PEP_ID=MMETSP1423-20130617/32415_1 /TAXON_ID=476441 /ORGANISM="Pseudo-nitzschia heimii, Strain UNC1101" /LENGTH=639 /DNA_ID=CAMNT_0042650355 /DNA_START=313 /DNA_END=2232 /DNA_ORIENTATION=-
MVSSIPASNLVPQHQQKVYATMNSTRLRNSSSNKIDQDTSSFLYKPTVSKRMLPNHLPPKSPASLAGRKLLSVGHNATLPSNQVSSSLSHGSSRRGSSSRRGGRGRSKSRNRRISSSCNITSDASCSSENSSSSASDSLIPKTNRIKDPSPIHLTVDTDTDDLSNSEHFSQLSFQKSKQGESDLNESTDSNIFRRNSVDASNRNRRRSHEWVKSCDSNSGVDKNSISLARAGIATQSCLAVRKVLRRKRVMVADVASLGNASDTLVSIFETHNGNGHGRITGRELHETAKAAMNEGDYEEALQMFEAILQAQLSRFGSEEHSSVGAALHNIGVVQLRIGRPIKAEEAFVRALAIRRNVLEINHLDRAATLAKLGSARTTLGKFDQGLHDLREALKVTRGVLGRNDRTVAQILCYIACLYFEAGELIPAQSTFEDALEIYREVFKVEIDRDACMAQLTETLCNIGSIQNKRKNFADAIESFREALYLQRGILGHDHPRVIATLDNLAYSFSKSKLYNQALTCYKEMLCAQISHYGSFTEECCDTLSKQVLICGKLKNVNRAIEVVTKHLRSIREESEDETNKENDPVTDEVNKMLIDLQIAKNKSSKSRSKTTKGGRHERSLDCLDRILFDKQKDRRSLL